MGLFWRIADYNYFTDHGLCLSEPVGTISPTWPFIWRLGRYRYLMEVKDDAHKNGYYLYSHTEKDHTMRFHHLIHTKYVLAPVGPENVCYWAETRERQSLRLVYTGIRVAGPLVRKPDGVKRSFIKQFAPAETITYT